ncbi:MAG: DUF4976 domain-containing protein, partial [Planctomycetaceae bacterium]|nr:DUF4976 domain-containing protein [Planctomycetaceae bacterium]
VTRPGSSSKALIETVDLFPTIAELAGLPAPKGPQPIDGDSFVPILKGDDSGIGEYAYHCFPKGNRLGRAIRTARYRLVEWKPLNGNAETEYELYDYQTDPHEKKNLADDRLDVVAKLSAILARHPEPKIAGRGNRQSSSGSQRVVKDSPTIANRPLTIVVEGKADSPQGVVLAQGGREHGFAIHFTEGRPAFDVRVNGKVTRITGARLSATRFQLTATLAADQMTLSVGDGKTTSTKSPGQIPVQPKDALSVGFDDESAAGNYDSPNPFTGTVSSFRISTSNGQVLSSFVATE